MTQDRPNPLPLSLSVEASAIAGITLTGYLSAYAFESGYAVTIGYPHDLIPPTLFSLLGIWTYILAFHALGFLQVSLQTIPISPFNNLVHILLVFISSSISIWLYAVAPPQISGLVILSGSILIITYMFFLNYIITDNSKSGNIGLVTNVYDAGSNVPVATPAYLLITRFGFDPLLYAFIASALLPAFSFSAGSAIAHSRGDYFMLHCEGGSMPPSVVVRRVSDYVVSLKLEPPTSGQISRNRFALQQVSDLSDCNFMRINR